jgi:hypothetical protein
VRGRVKRLEGERLKGGEGVCQMEGNENLIPLIFNAVTVLTF